MNASEARSLSNSSKAMKLIQQAALRGKTSVAIPQEFIDCEFLRSQGYRVNSPSSQFCESCIVSWEQHWRD